MDARKTGSLIAQLREEKQLTREELAEKLRVSEKTVSSWERGKKLPNMTVLKPLSILLDVRVSDLLAGEQIDNTDLRDKTDELLIRSFHHRARKLAFVHTTCIIFAIIALLSSLCLFIPILLIPTPVEFVNNSRTHMLYMLTDDNTQAGTTYEHLEKIEFSGGYEYSSADGSERYVFTPVPGYSKEPVMSYMHCSGDGVLFGFRIGDNTTIEANETLGIESQSLIQYLKDNRFKSRAKDNFFGRPNAVYINGERCQWCPFSRGNVFINICISTAEGNRLIGYDIGLIESSVDPIIAELGRGFSLTVEDPYNLITGTLQTAYPQYQYVMIEASAPEAPHEQLYLYINGQFAGTFSPGTDEKRTTAFLMPGRATTILITPKKTR